MAHFREIYLDGTFSRDTIYLDGAFSRDFFETKNPRKFLVMWQKSPGSLVPATFFTNSIVETR
jgi:hypothetical protein